MYIMYCCYLIILQCIGCCCMWYWSACQTNVPGWKYSVYLWDSLVYILDCTKAKYKYVKFLGSWLQHLSKCKCTQILTKMHTVTELSDLIHGSFYFLVKKILLGPVSKSLPLSTQLLLLSVLPAFLPLHSAWFENMCWYCGLTHDTFCWIFHASFLPKQVK